MKNQVTTKKKTIDCNATPVVVDRTETQTELLKLMYIVLKAQKQYLQIYRQGKLSEPNETLHAFADLYSRLQEENSEQIFNEIDAVTDQELA